MDDCFFYFYIQHGTISRCSILVLLWSKDGRGVAQDCPLLSLSLSISLSISLSLRPSLPASLPPTHSYLLMMFETQQIFTHVAFVLVICKANLKQYLLTWPSRVRSCMAHAASCWQRSPCNAILNTYLQERLLIIIWDTLRLKTISSLAWEHQWEVWLRWNIF